MSIKHFLSNYRIWILNFSLVVKTYFVLFSTIILLYMHVSFTSGTPVSSTTFNKHEFIPNPVELNYFNTEEFTHQYRDDFGISTEDNTKTAGDLVQEFQEANSGTFTSAELIDRMILFVSDTFQYDMDYKLTGMSDAMLSGRGICWHYAYLFSALCDSYDIPNEILYGKVSPGDRPHVWNRVAIDGDWYYFDLTWFDSGERGCVWRTEYDMKNILDYDAYRVVWPMRTDWIQ